MGKSLVVVESPAKAKTIHKFLGKGYEVKASMGHVCDLPAKELGVNIADDFRPKYVVIQGKRKILSELKKAAGNADEVLLATDPDREGEAIAWHVANRIARKGDTVHRILFNEITERAIRRAVEHPLALDMNKVNAQQARRILDRLVGYKVSPVLWKTVRGGLSAGRVQSVALRLICEREEEIQRFVPKEYWSITATLKGADTEPFDAELIRKANRKIAIPNEERAQAIMSELKGAPLRVVDVQRRDQRRDPPPPFITSTLQQEASRKLGFPAWKTMRIAQELYEGIDLEGETTGLITYMRTDSTRMAKEAMTQAREYIAGAYGLDYVPQKPRVFRRKKGAQDAHEAIRPTHVSRTPKKIKKFLNDDQRRLYELIWSRFVACQMSSAILDVITVDIKALDYLFRSSGSTIKFMGFMTLYKKAKEENEEARERNLPTNLHIGETLALLSLKPEQHFTKPPSRYSEATLIKELEAKGIGRPSTYAEILSKIQDREYVVKEKGRFVPTDLGTTVNQLLLGAFPEIFDIAFTAKMEEELDRIETGKENWVRVIGDFYDSFEQTLKTVNGRRTELKESLQEQTDILCDQCGRKMVIKWGRHGRFLSCSGFPECKNAKPLEEESGKQEVTGEKCNQCGADMVIRSGKYGRFLACSAYPKCKNTKPITLGIPCPEPYCTGELVEKRTKRGKIFYGCSAYPTCTFATWYKPVEQTCPTCGAPFLVEKTTKAKGTFLYCLSCKTEIDV